MSLQSEPTKTAIHPHHDIDYAALLGSVRDNFKAKSGDGPLFTTDASGLWGTYLDSLPSDRQVHDCRACKRFIETYGGLVAIDADGRSGSPIWPVGDEVPPFYAAAFAAMNGIVRKARVTGVFLSPMIIWGNPETGPWRHLSVTPNPKSTHRLDSILTAGQTMAEKKEDFGQVMRALADFELPHLEMAVMILDSESLYRTEKVLGPAKWLRDLQVARMATKNGRVAENLVWRAVASAPAGFCHPRTSMIGTLLEDIAAGMDFSEVSRRFAAKMHPLAYQRPQAAPSAGAIAQAEKLVEQMGVARSLARRFARIDEIEAVWRPAPAKGNEPTGGVFSHLKPKGPPLAKAMEIPPITMTWEKFAREILPGARSIEAYVPSGNLPFTAMVTAVEPESPPIFQWDHLGRRNPVSMYVWNGGAPARQFNLAPASWHAVSAIAMPPHHWGDPSHRPDHHASGVIFFIEGARETRSAGLAIFPETLKSELHGVRSVIEAHSRQGTIEGIKDSSASGLAWMKGSAWNATIRVRGESGVQSYKLDRWD